MMLIKLSFIATQKIKQLFCVIRLLFMVFLVLVVVSITLAKQKKRFYEEAICKSRNGESGNGMRRMMGMWGIWLGMRRMWGWCRNALNRSENAGNQGKNVGNRGGNARNLVRIRGIGVGMRRIELK